MNKADVKTFKHVMREQFEAHCLSYGYSITRYMRRNQFLGHINPDTQGRWCAWFDATLWLTERMQQGKPMPTKEQVKGE